MEDPFRKPSPQGSVIRIDPCGDLRFKITQKDNEVVFIVCSKTLRRSWKSLEWYHSPQEWTHGAIQMPFHNTDAVAIILRIIHSQFANIPEALDVMDFYDLALLTHKFDLAHLLRPWAKRWFQKMEDMNSFVGERLWIAWELGHCNLFTKLVRQVIFERASPAQPEYTRALMPIGVHDFIDRARRDAISLLLMTPCNFIRHLLTSRRCFRESNNECDRYMTESMVQSLTVMGLYPLPPIHQVKMSVFELYSKLALVEVRGKGYMHTCESIKMVPESAMADLGRLFTIPAVMKHQLNERAEKTGMPTNDF
ncbi:uncharacterized protein GGS25DRAFT_504670 [Hypoxylon fragiforme]|uniref:uncharacterized protein n=1 Tax=Hypoxylon fragiforme TaxID=63214 RepID=UPI0020C6887B|nr:uncharacterized protein GGS25DRAFT_504670 [Hypoxylon fragiforme]KAI2605319.1 hypothetical protein GGS25DRAFT_504670 [Hypoxylon fragiforme]